MISFSLEASWPPDISKLVDLVTDSEGRDSNLFKSTLAKSALEEEALECASLVTSSPSGVLTVKFNPASLACLFLIIKSSLTEDFEERAAIA